VAVESRAVAHAVPIPVSTLAGLAPSGRAADWLGALLRVPGEPHRGLLLMRFALVNLVGLAGLGVAVVEGWAGRVLAADATGLVAVIGTVFLAGLAVASRRAMQLAFELDQLHASRPHPDSRVARYLAAAGAHPAQRASLEGALKLSLAQRVGGVRQIAGALVMLGLVGTVLGFIIALSGVDPARAGDVDSVAPMVSTLVAGMGVALYTTLVGAVLNIWLMQLHRLLEGGAVRLLAGLIERGATRAEP
jgi:hypothetical protein